MQIQSVPPPTHQKHVYASLTRVGWDVGSESDGKHPHVEQEPPYSGANPDYISLRTSHSNSPKMDDRARPLATHVNLCVFN